MDISHSEFEFSYSQNNNESVSAQLSWIMDK